MTEIPEHLLKRAAAAREKSAEAAPAAETPAASDAAAPAEAAAPSDSRIPEHLLQRSKAAKASKAGGEAEAPTSGGAVAVAEKVGAVVAAVPAVSITSPIPIPAVMAATNAFAPARSRTRVSSAPRMTITGSRPNACWRCSSGPAKRIKTPPASIRASRRAVVALPPILAGRIRYTPPLAGSPRPAHRTPGPHSRGRQ